MGLGIARRYKSIPDLVWPVGFLELYPSMRKGDGEWVQEGASSGKYVQFGERVGADDEHYCAC